MGQAMSASVGASRVVLTPRSGAQLSFGEVVKISWTSGAAEGNIPYRVELWREGAFQTRLSGKVHAHSLEWFVEPQASAPGFYENPFANSSLLPSLGAVVGTRTSYSLEPADRYTVRVCDWRLDEDQPFAEQICDHEWAESGEFDVLSSLLVDSPACGSSYEAPSRITVSWAAFYTQAAAMTVSLFTADNVLIFEDALAADSGEYGFFADEKAAGGDYRFRVRALCDASAGCDNYWMLRDYGNSPPLSVAQVVGYSCTFKVVAAGKPPPSPPPPRLPPAPPGLPWEVPILKVFDAGYYGRYSIAQGHQHDYSARSGFASIGFEFIHRRLRRLLASIMEVVAGGTSGLAPSRQITPHEMQMRYI